MEEARVDQPNSEPGADSTRIAEDLENLPSEFRSERGSMGSNVDGYPTSALRTQSEAAGQRLHEQSERNSRIEEEVDRIRLKLETRANAIIEALEEKREQAGELVEVMSTSTTAGAFAKEAKVQKREADQWRILTVSIGIAAAVVAVAAIGVSIALGTSPPLVIAEIGAVALLLGLADYAARQAALHRRREERARRLELDVTAVGPLTSALSESDKQRMRSEFAERLLPSEPR
jgi:anti-sigma-K factor RskA